MSFSALPDPVELAIPAFIVLLLAEIFWAWRRAPDEYETMDTAASLAMGFGNLAIGIAQAGLVLAATEWVYRYRIFDIGYSVWAFVAIFVAEDFCYYWFHRLSHEYRFWWAAHVNHHSSQHYNLSTALRQTWTGGIAGTFVVWLPLALIGFPPALIAFEKGVSLVYQFWIHTRAIDRLPAWFEAIFNTPSHHRVHHATNPRYLDSNYAGILIVWDRLFGTFVPEDDVDPIRYGLVRNICTFNPLKIALHEWVAIAHDVRRAKSMRDAFMYVFGPPGWSPDGAGKTSVELRAVWRARRAAAQPARNAIADDTV